MKSTGSLRFAALTLVCLLLLGTVVSIAEAQQVNGRNAVEVSYGNGTTVTGTFRKGSDGLWRQTDTSGKVVATFKETGRDDWSIYLAATTGSSSAMLNLFRKEVTLNSGGASTLLGKVISALDKVTETAAQQVNGRNAVEVRYGNGTTVSGTFSKGTDGLWRQTDASGNVVATFKETGRDDWSIYLAGTTGSSSAMLNLFRKEVTLNSGGASTLLGKVISASATLATAVNRSAPAPTPAPTPAVTANGTNAAEVTFGNNSIFRKTSERGWLQLDSANQVVANCAETGRDQWTVFLDCPSNQTKIAINLFQKKVTSRALNGAETALGNVISASATPTLLQSTTRSASTSGTGGAALKSPLSPEDLEAVMAWIADEVSDARTPYCYKRTYGRGAGKPLETCQNGMVEDAGLCYTPCKAGYGQVATRCYKSCPAGYRDDGLFCAKPEPYTRPGFPWQAGDPLLPDYSGPIKRCEAANGKGNCEQWGAIIYPKCRQGFHNVASDICSPDCPAGMNDIGVSCAKDFYDRGIGKIMECNAGEERGGLLCYPVCKGGFEGNGPVCWQQCNGNQKVQCGVGCADSNDTCATVTSDMVLAPINMIVSLATMGLSSSVTSGANAATEGIAKLAMGDTSKWASLMKAVEKAAEVVDKTTYAIGIIDNLNSEVDRWTNDYENNFAANTSPAVNSKIDSVFGPTGARYIKREWAKYQLTAFLEADGWRIGKFVLSIASIEPTGIVSVINAYAHPVCKDISPNAKPATQTDGENVTTVTFKTAEGVGSLRVSDEKSWRWWPLNDKVGIRSPGIACDELRRDQWSVYLACGLAKTKITIDLYTKKVNGLLTPKSPVPVVGTVIRTGNGAGYNPWPNVKLLYR